MTCAECGHRRPLIDGLCPTCWATIGPGAIVSPTDLGIIDRHHPRFTKEQEMT